MTKPADPEIESVDRTDNSVIVQFKDEEKPAIYPAGLLHASIGIAAIMHERDIAEEEELEKGS